jgi:hypothetical protein
MFPAKVFWVLGIILVVLLAIEGIRSHRRRK